MPANVESFGFTILATLPRTEQSPPPFRVSLRLTSHQSRQARSRVATAAPVMPVAAPPLTPSHRLRPQACSLASRHRTEGGDAGPAAEVCQTASPTVSLRLHIPRGRRQNMRTKKNLLAFRNGGRDRAASCEHVPGSSGSCGSHEAARWLRRAREDWQQARAIIRQAKALRADHDAHSHLVALVCVAQAFRKSAIQCQEKARQCQPSANECQK